MSRQQTLLKQAILSGISELKVDDNMSEGVPQKQSLYVLIGGDTGVRELVDRFYDRMDLDPNYADIRKMHPSSLVEARDKLYWYFSGWMGGPDLFVERFGHPRMRARHSGFSIGANERDQWLGCMKIALQDSTLDEAVKEKLLQAFRQIAEAIRNQPE